MVVVRLKNGEIYIGIGEKEMRNSFKRIRTKIANFSIFLLRWRAPGPPRDRVSPWLPLTQQAAPLAGQAGAAGIPADRGTGGSSVCPVASDCNLSASVSLSFCLPLFRQLSSFCWLYAQAEKGELSSWYMYSQGADPSPLPLRVTRQVEIISERGNYPLLPTGIGERCCQTISNL